MFGAFINKLGGIGNMVLQDLIDQSQRALEEWREFADTNLQKLDAEAATYHLHLLLQLDAMIARNDERTRDIVGRLEALRDSLMGLRLEQKESAPQPIAAPPTHTGKKAPPIEWRYADQRYADPVYNGPPEINGSRVARNAHQMFDAMEQLQ